MTKVDYYIRRFPSGGVALLDGNKVAVAYFNPDKAAAYARGALVSGIVRGGFTLYDETDDRWIAAPLGQLLGDFA